MVVYSRFVNVFCKTFTWRVKLLRSFVPLKLLIPNHPPHPLTFFFLWGRTMFKPLCNNLYFSFDNWKKFCWLLSLLYLMDPVVLYLHPHYFLLLSSQEVFSPKWRTFATFLFYQIIQNRLTFVSGLRTECFWQLVRRS